MFYLIKKHIKNNNNRIRVLTFNKSIKKYYDFDLKSYIIIF